MTQKITVQQLYDFAHNRETHEYIEAVEELSQVCGCYKYDEDNEKEIDTQRPTVAANPKHYEGVADFKIVAISGHGLLDLEDEWGNVLEGECSSAIEYGHLQYVTEFIWLVIEDRLKNNLIEKLLKANTQTVNYRDYTNVVWHDSGSCALSGEVLIDGVTYRKKDNTLVLNLDKESKKGKPQLFLSNVVFEERISLLKKLLTSI